MQPMIQHILVPTDFGATSANAIAYAASMARALGARLHLLHVLEQPFVTSGPYEFHLPDTPDLHDRRYQRALTELRRTAAALEGIEVSAEVRDGTAMESIVKAAIDYGAQLIVMGTYEGNALKQLITGKTSDRLRRVAPCPVLAVRERSDAHAIPVHERRLVA